MPGAQQAAPWIFYSSVGLIILTPFLFRTTALFVVSLIGFIYPTFASTVAIYKHDETLIGQWLSYWVVYVGFLTIQKIFGAILWKIPFYPLLQALFLIALMHYPVGDHHTLAKYFFWMYLAKYFGEAAVEANEAIVEVAAAAAGEISEDPRGSAEQLSGNENRGNHAAVVEYNALFIVGPTGNSEDSQGEAGRDVSSDVQTLSASSATEETTHAMEESTRATEESACVTEEPTRAMEESTRTTEESTRTTEESTCATESTMTTNHVAKRLAELRQEVTGDIQSHTVTDASNNADVNREEASPSSSSSIARLDDYGGRFGLHSELQASSLEVLILSKSEEDLDVDVDDI